LQQHADELRPQLSRQLPLHVPFGVQHVPPAVHSPLEHEQVTDWPHALTEPQFWPSHLGRLQQEPW
jgi:hypothetical protein